jgi:prepilin peptidase CpaA
MTSEALALTLVVAGTGIGAAIDLRTRRVPNAVTMSLAAIGIAVAAAGFGRIGPGAALLGLLAGLALMLPGHVLGATGAGDVKLLAATGTLLGPAGVLWAFLYTLLAGGAIALLVALCRGRLRKTIDALTWLVFTRGANAHEIEQTGTNNRFAYAPAIAIGAVLAAL